MRVHCNRKLKTLLLKKHFHTHDFSVPSDYCIYEIISESPHHVIVHGYDKFECREVIIKKLPSVFTNSYSHQKRVLCELVILSLFQGSKNIIEVYEYYYDRESIYIVMEYGYVNLGKLMLEHSKGLRNEEIKYFMYSMVLGVWEMHRMDIIHGDIKPRNFVICRDCDIKLIDFGVSFEGRCEGKKQALNYRAPEVLLGLGGGEKIDMWSLGCCLGEMLSVDNKVMFGGRDQIDQLDRIFRYCKDTYIYDEKINNYLGSIKKDLGVDSLVDITSRGQVVVDLLQKMLQIDPNKRLSAQQALKHEYFDELYDTDDLQHTTTTHTKYKYLMHGVNEKNVTARIYNFVNMWNDDNNIKYKFRSLKNNFINDPNVMNYFFV